MSSEHALTVAWFGHAGAQRHDGLATYAREITAGLRRHGQRVIFFIMRGRLVPTR